MLGRESCSDPSLEHLHFSIIGNTISVNDTLTLTSVTIGKLIQRKLFQYDRRRLQIEEREARGPHHQVADMGHGWAGEVPHSDCELL